MYSLSYPMPWQPIYAETPRSWRRWHISSLAFGIVAGALYFFASLVSPPSGAMKLANLGFPMLFIIMLIWMGIFLYFHYRVFKPWAKQRKLAIGRCRACDYHLTNLTPEADGCTVCPECSAAWRLDQAAK